MGGGGGGAKLEHVSDSPQHLRTSSLRIIFPEQRERRWENDYIAFDEYYNEPIGRSFGNCEIPFVTS